MTKMRCAHSLLSAFYILFLSLVSASYPYKQLYQFPNDSFVHIEGMAVRPNGVLLLTVITSPTIYYLDTQANGTSAKWLYKFPGALSLTGISQLQPDVFAVVVGNYSYLNYAGIKGSFSIWTLNLRSSRPVATRVAGIPEAVALNGMATLTNSTDTVLVADSTLGVVWRVNTTTGNYTNAIQDPYFAPTSAFPLGINGLKTKGSVLYFTNSALNVFGKLNITATGLRAGNVTVITNNTKGATYDDFALGTNATAWVTNHPGHVSAIQGNAEIAVVGNDTTTDFEQPTACVFGVGSPTEQCTLYVGTGGRQFNASYIISGQVVAINTC